MQKRTRRNLPSIALLTGAAIMSLSLFQPAPAQAADKDKKEKLYKGGAAALGILGAYWILDGKTVPGAAAAAGAYYAYKKGRDLDRDDHNYQDDWYDNRTNGRYDDRYDNRAPNRRDSSPRYRSGDYGSGYDYRDGYQRDGYRPSQGYSAATPAKAGASSARTNVVLR